MVNTESGRSTRSAICCRRVFVCSGIGVMSSALIDGCRLPRLEAMVRATTISHNGQPTVLETMRSQMAIRRPRGRRRGARGACRVGRAPAPSGPQRRELAGAQGTLNAPHPLDGIGEPHCAQHDQPSAGDGSTQKKTKSSRLVSPTMATSMPSTRSSTSMPRSAPSRRGPSSSSTITLV